MDRWKPFELLLLVGGKIYHTSLDAVVREINKLPYFIAAQGGVLVMTYNVVAGKNSSGITGKGIQIIAESEELREEALKRIVEAEIEFPQEFGREITEIRRVRIDRRMNRKQ